MDLTKTQICREAKQLFNQKGYRSVSMREIAAKAGISLGTLTYHFARKQDLLEAIMDSNIQTFPDSPPETIKDFHLLLYRLLESIVESPFYFNDPSIYRTIPAIQNQDYINVGHLFQLMESSLQALADKGLFCPMTPERIHQLAMLLLLSHTGWTQYNSSRSADSKIPLEEILNAQWAALFPYLTPKGLEEYKTAVAP